MSFYQNPIKYCNMAIYCNTLKCNTQYGLDLYCFTPSVNLTTFIQLYNIDLVNSVALKTDLTIL